MSKTVTGQSEHYVISGGERYDVPEEGEVMSKAEEGMTEAQVQAYARRCYKILQEHKVVGVSGYGVEQIMCDCNHNLWHSASNYSLHLSRVLAEEMK